MSDVLKRAGGYTADAYPEGAFLKRFKKGAEKLKSEDVARRLQKNIKDTAAKNMVVEEITRDYDQIPLDILYIMKSPGSVEDLAGRGLIQAQVRQLAFTGQKPFAQLPQPITVAEHPIQKAY